MAFEAEERFVVLDHPLVKHKIALIRDKNTPASIFRLALKELTILEAYEATKHLKLQPIQIETPIATTTGEVISGQEPVIVPILRTGLAMLDGLLEIIPNAPVGHLGMFRDEVTYIPQEYYAKMPPMLAQRQVLLVDPMLATGGSLIAALHALRERGVQDITAMTIVSAPEGVRAVLDADANVRLFTCALDKCLNEHAYIVPGLGDAGDRVYQTLGTPVESKRHASKG